jgi:hypothetical protein
VALEPVLEAVISASLSGTLKVEASEPAVTVRVDGQQAPGTSAGFVLPHGRHLLRVERAGFVPFERTVWVKQGEVTTVQVELQPTAETLSHYVERATVQQTWGWIALLSGVAVTAGGVGYLVYNAREIEDAQAEYDATVYDSVKGSGRVCDVLEPETNHTQCEEDLSTRYENLQNAKDMTKFGYIVAGTGAAVAGIGLYLLVTGDDPDRYASPHRSPRTGSTWLPVATVSGEQGWFGLRGRF